MKKFEVLFIAIFLICIFNVQVVNADAASEGYTNTVPLTINSITLNDVENPAIFMYNDVLYLPDFMWGILNIEVVEDENCLYINRMDLSGIERFEWNSDENTAEYEAYEDAHVLVFEKEYPDLYESSKSRVISVDKLSASDKQIFINNIPYSNTEYPIFKWIDIREYEYPVTEYTFLPLTHEICSEIFGWEVEYTQETGLTIIAEGHFRYCPLGVVRDVFGRIISMSGSAAKNGWEYFVFDNKIFAVPAATEAINTGIYIGYNGKAPEKVQLQDNISEMPFWDFGSALKFDTTFAGENSARPFYHKLKWKYDNGILTINASCTLYDDIERAAKYVYIFADVTIDLSTGEVLSVDNLVTVARREGYDEIVD